MSNAFPSTAWSTIQRLGEGSEGGARRALEDLCAGYWLPLYSFLRRSRVDETEAEEIVQAFFLFVVESNAFIRARRSHGRFRTFLIAALKNFLANQRRYDRAQKRRPARGWLSLEDQAAEQRFSAIPCAGLTPEESFERAWAVAMIERAIAQVRAGEGAPAEDSALAIALGGDSRSYREAAAELGISEAAFKVRVARLRKKLGWVLRRLVAETVSDEALIDGELRHLLRLWGTARA